MKQQDYQQLASEFIDLWQKQLGQMVTDKQFIESMFQGLQQMANVANPNSHEHATTSSPDDVAEQLSQLDFRLRMVEGRLQKLESKHRAKKPAAKTTGSRTKRSTKKS